MPVGIKSAVGDLTFWEDLARLMERGGRGLDFITIDGGERGTGAGPLVFTDHVALPFKVGFSRVVTIFQRHQAANLLQSPCDGSPNPRPYPNTSATVFEPKRCHTNHCPTGVAT